MTITYEQILPWGRSFNEYRRMFRLDDSDLQQHIIGCGDGPAAFNACMNRRGTRVVSVDPIYHFDRLQIAKRIVEVTGEILEQTRQNYHLFRWDTIRDIDDLSRIRHQAMCEFLEDYVVGLAEGRYVAAQLPNLPFANKSFDLALCSHFLFMYSDHLDMEFHLRAIEEMLRVAHEVRVFPVLDMNAQVSSYLPAVMRRWQKPHDAQLVAVDYEFQIGANQMLVIRDA